MIKSPYRSEAYKFKNAVEAEEPLLIMVKQCDIDGAKPLEPRLCAFARACMRQEGSLDPAFFGQIAYVDRIDPKDRVRKMFRYVMLADCVKWIGSFDKGRPRPGSQFVLMPPTKGRTLAALRARKKVTKKSAGDRKIIRRPVIRRMPLGRNGAGQIQKYRGIT